MGRMATAFATEIAAEGQAPTLQATNRADSAPMPDATSSPTRRISVSAMLTYSIGAVIAATLLYSSYFHLKNPFAFLVSITRYGLVNGAVAPWLAIALPWWQLALGLALLLRHWPRITALLTAILLTAFTLAQSSAVFRGLDIGCGCFGVVGEEKITAFTATRVGVLCAFAWLICGVEFWRQPSLAPAEIK
jgi:Methylamine utilisation protein MauE